MNHTEHQNDFDKLLILVKKQAQNVGIPYSKKLDPHVGINTKAKKRFGLCIRIKDLYKIELSAMLLTAPEKACCQTLAHELIHTCEGCGNHGALFKEYAERMNRAYGYQIKRTNTCEDLGLPAALEKPVSANYIIVCQSCGHQFQRVRYCAVVAHPSRYRCRCGGQLKRIK